MTRVARYLLYAQLSLFVFILVCTLIIPHFLFERNEGGVSNYGIYARTVIPYSLAYGLCAVLTIRSALLIPKTVPLYRQLKYMLLLLGFLYLIVLLSTYPYKINHVFGIVHEYVDLLLFVFEIIAASWLAFILVRRARTIVLFAIQLAGTTLLLLTLIGSIHILFITEVLTGFAFGLLLVDSVAYLTATPKNSTAVS